MSELACHPEATAGELEVADLSVDRPRREPWVTCCGRYREFGQPANWHTSPAVGELGEVATDVDRSAVRGWQHLVDRAVRVRCEGRADLAGRCIEGENVVSPDVGRTAGVAHGREGTAHDDHVANPSEGL